MASKVPRGARQRLARKKLESALAAQGIRNPHPQGTIITSACLYVRLPAYDDTTIARMDRVTQEFDDELCRASGYLLLTTDFRPPRAERGV
jgi:hypothetical protein